MPVGAGRDVADTVWRGWRVAEWDTRMNGTDRNPSAVRTPCSGFGRTPCPGHHRPGPVDRAGPASHATHRIEGGIRGRHGGGERKLGVIGTGRCRRATRTPEDRLSEAGVLKLEGAAPPPSDRTSTPTPWRPDRWSTAVVPCFGPMGTLHTLPLATRIATTTPHHQPPLGFSHRPGAYAISYWGTLPGDGVTRHSPGAYLSGPCD